MKNRWIIPFVIFLIALFVRLPGLDIFLTIDEPRWTLYASRFSGGLLWSDYSCPPVDQGRSVAATGLLCTLNLSVPGVTTMWLGSLGHLIYYFSYVSLDLSLQEYLTDITPIDAQMVAAVRLPLVVINALFFPIFYILVVKLFKNWRLALIASLLIALHPMHIGLSRVVHHDALNTTFLLFSMLMFVGYRSQNRGRFWLIGSACMAGLAILSKPISWILPPFVLLVSLPALYDSTTRRQAVASLLGWGVGAGLTIIFLFPAIWVDPVTVFRDTFVQNFFLANAGHSKFFLGEVTLDPGPLYYGLGWLLMLTPLEIVGFLALLPYIYQNRDWLKNPLNWSILLGLGLFLMLVIFSSKKHIRYLLPMFPLLALFAAQGWLWLGKQLRQSPRTSLGLIILIIVCGQGWLVWRHTPYFFTYYNPLLGGASAAAEMITVGWGEGMDQAARYLNQQPNADQLRVGPIGAAGTFTPLFVGDTIGASSNQRALEADYLLYYHSAIQRISTRSDNLPMWNFLQDHHQPVHRVTLNGLDYALLYQPPALDLIFEDVTLADQTLLGYQLKDDTLMLLWEPTHANISLKVALANPGQPPTDWQPCPLAPKFDLLQDEIVESLCPLTVSASEFGLYAIYLQIGEQTSVVGYLATNQAGQFNHLTTQQALDQLASQQLSATAHPLTIPLNDQVQIVGYRLTQNQLTLYWQVAAQLNLTALPPLQISLEDATQQIKLPLLDDDMATRLRPGAVVTTSYEIATLDASQPWRTCLGPVDQPDLTCFLAEP